MEMCVWLSRLWVPIPTALPDICISYFKVMNGIVTTIEPADIESCFGDQWWILVVVEREFEMAR